MRRPRRLLSPPCAAEDGDRARLLAERHVEGTLQRLTAMRLAMPQISVPQAR